MTKLFETIVCPRCHQDRLVISISRDTGELFLSCGECEASWSNMEDTNDETKMLVDLSGNFDDPTLDEVKSRGWDIYITRIVDS
ncbi:MAG: hypothetical protein LBB76_12215 [Azoarcus sp.]|jgi:transcription elongation factor Elf1|nr:hypothetical protein [Azoarcus sp.]